MQALEVTMTIRLDPQTKAELERQAQAEDRKPGALARLLLRDGLRARGGRLLNDQERQPYTMQRGQA